VDKEAYFRDWCRTIKGRIDVPLIMVGGLRTFTLMEEIVRNGEADFVALCRPLIREPGIINEWRSDKNRKAACISCNRCYEALYRGVSLRCIVEEESPCS
jgi:2,4-dienoyl-CoA reductase-like NADH-dependent reductase (Old Yellow Enzyme family)